LKQKKIIIFRWKKAKKCQILSWKIWQTKEKWKVECWFLQNKGRWSGLREKKIVMVSLWVSLLKKTWVAVGNMKLVKRKKERKKKIFFVILNFGWNMMDYSQLQLDPSKLQFLNRYLTTTIDESYLSDKTDQLVSFRICSTHSSKTVFRCHRSSSIVIPFWPKRLKYLIIRPIIEFKNSQGKWLPIDD
jgi:hypothetical protein